MKNDVQHWIKHEGVTFIKVLGIGVGQVVVDFGCNAGHYTIPAARVVGSEGTVYAIDQEKSAIDQLMKTAQSEGLGNIIPIISSNPAIDLPTASIDAVFIYDVLHYLNTDERKKLYQSVNTILKDNGILSVFPKHNLSDSPMWHLAKLSITNIIKEVENCHFLLVQKDEKRLIHDDYFETGMIINFKKSNLKLAVPSNDGKNIFTGMLGRALKFLIFEIDLEGNYQLIEKRPNPYAQTMQHLKTLDVYNLIDDCSVILSSKIGKKGIERLEQRNMILVFREGNIRKQISDVLENEISDLSNRR